MLNGNRSMLGVCYQLTLGPGLAAQRLKYLQVFGTGPHDTGGRALCQRGYERERPLKRRWRIKDPRVGHDAKKAGQSEYR